MARFGNFVADTDVTKSYQLLGTDSGGASKFYRLEVAKNLLEKCFVEIKEKKLIKLYA